MPERCGLAPWGLVEGADVYVDPTAQDGDGSAEHPLSSLDEAIAQAGGGHIALAAGTWTGPFWIEEGHDGLVIEGRCPELSSLVGGEDPAVLVAMGLGDRLTLSGLTVRDSDTFGVEIGQGIVTLDEAVLQANTTTQILVDGPRAKAELYRTTILDGRTHASGWGGIGVYARDGGDVLLEDVEIRGHRTGGVWLEGLGSELDLTRTQVLDGQPDDDGHAHGVVLLDGAMGTMSELVVDEALGSGLIVDGASAAVVDSSLLAVREGSRGIPGLGVQAFDAQLSLQRTTIESADAMGMALYQSQTTLEEVALSDCGPGHAEGRGVYMEDGGLDAADLSITSTTGTALDLNGAGVATVQGLDISEVVPGGSGYGVGVVAWDGVDAHLSGVRVQGVRGSALVATGSGSSLGVEDFEVLDSTDPGTGAAGLLVQQGASVEARDGMVARSQGSNASVTGGSTLVLERVSLEEVQPPGHVSYGLGLESFESTVSATEVQILGGTGGGMALHASEVRLEDSLVHSPQPGTDGVGGIGIQALDGTHLTLAGVEVDAAHFAGLSAWASTVEADTLLIIGTRPDASQHSGLAIELRDGAHLDLVSGGMETTTGVGLFSVGSTAVLREVTVRRVWSIPGVGLGMGILASEGSTLSAESLLVDRAQGAAVALLGEGTTATLSDVEVVGIERGSSFDIALGIHAQAGATAVIDTAWLHGLEGTGLSANQASLACTDCTVEAGTYAGVVCTDATLSLTRPILRGILPDDSEGGGVGLLAEQRQGTPSLVVEGGSVSDCPRAAAYLHGPGHYSLSGVELQAGEGIDYGPLVVHGDGVVALEGVSRHDGSTGLLLDQSTLSGAVGAGLLLHGSSATLQGNTWTDNASEVVVQGCDQAGAASPDGSDTPEVQLCPDRDRVVLTLEAELSLSEEEVQP